MKPGPRPTPTAILHMRGSWLADARAATEPRASAASPRSNPPEWLPKRAKGAWRILAPKLAKQGCLADVDREPLARYCFQLDLWRDLADWMDRHRAEKSSYPLKNSAGVVIGEAQFSQVNQYHRMTDQLLKLEREFGMTAAARAAIGNEGIPHGTRTQERPANEDAAGDEARGKERFFSA